MGGEVGKKKKNELPARPGPSVTLPKDALTRIKLGNSFAEYDATLEDSYAFVVTNQIQLAAREGERSRCFFVGRRGTGKTATTLYLANQAVKEVSHGAKPPLLLHPQVFALQSLKLDDVEAYRNTRDRPFRSILFAFERALIDEVVAEWVRRRLIKVSELPPVLRSDKAFIEEHDFDERLLAFAREALAALKDDDTWLRLTKRISVEMRAALGAVWKNKAWNVTVLLDRIDDNWDGTDQAVILLMALMHACVELSKLSATALRPMLFMRENIFERVRETDNEFSRLETFVVSMDWPEEQLVELVERRLNLPFHTRMSLRGPTWDHFFESPASGPSSREAVFSFCQYRPRDVLTYVSFAIDTATSRNHSRVMLEDLAAAKRRFSDSRLKDLGDEYAENYPRLELVLGRFFGLGQRFTISGLENFIQKLLADEQVTEHCKSWLYQHIQPERFAHLLFNIGFLGFDEGGGPQFRSLGAKSTTPPPLSIRTVIVIHPSYAEALELRDVLITELHDALRESGVLTDLPDAIDLTTYRNRLVTLLDELSTLPTGKEHDSKYEDLVGEVIRLCFFRALTNLVPQSRDVDGRIRRDWIASNRAAGGFWETIRQRYDATQIIWECKNYEDLKASDFHQFSYYATKAIGRFVVVSFRGAPSRSDFEHVKRISQDKDGCILLLGDKDLKVFIRQAISGKVKDDHLQNRYDETVRMIS